MAAARTLPVSAVITAYNSAWCLERAVDSVRAQSEAPSEILIVDDGSTDGTAQVAGRMGGVRYLWKPNGGAASARNFAWREARQEWIAFLDADDLWMPRKLARQWLALAGEPGAEFCLGLTQLQVQGDGGYVDQGAPWPAPSLGASLISRRLFERLGGFDEGLRTSEDLEWIMRCRKSGVKLLVLQEAVQWYLLRPGSLTTGQPGRERDMLAALRKVIRQPR